MNRPVLSAFTIAVRACVLPCDGAGIGRGAFSSIRQGSRVSVALAMALALLATVPRSVAQAAVTNAGPVRAARIPGDEVRSFQFADAALTAELVAAEPAVRSPVAIAWDPRGRMFVAEMRDYPNSTNGGSIRLLEDRDDDGLYESATTFADGLSFPNSVLPWNGGVLVTAAPDLWLLRDTDGDGRADERRVLFTGFAAGNQQLRANGLTWGFDGWVYGANGRSDGQVRRVGSTNAGIKTVSLRGRDFRFRPDTGEFETLAGRSQFGLGLDVWGGRYLSWNTIPVRFEVMPDRYLAAHPQVAGADVLADLLPPGDNGRIHPLTPAPRVFNNESSSHFNALAGLTIYRGSALGTAYHGNAFVGESLRNLVHRRILEPAGASYVARRGEDQTEFLRSSDPWFHPVNFATGPDGALYVVDFYREFVEHPDFVPREMRDRVPWRTGHEYGRIWRIVRRGAVRAPRGPAPATLSIAALVRELDQTNSWRRETAQQLLIEKRAIETIEPLRQMARHGREPVARFLAGRALAAVAPVTDSDLAEALQDSAPSIRAWALGSLLDSGLQSNGAPRDISAPLRAALLEAAGDRDARVRLAAALALRLIPTSPSQPQTLQRLRERDPDRWVRLAAISSSPELTKAQVTALLPRPTGSARPAPAPASPDPNRQQVVEKFRPALQLTGIRTRGAATFGRLCLPCHYLQGHGARVGPDLSGIAARPLEALLTDVLDPSRQVAPEYAAYEATLTDGESITGLFASETETRITLRRAGLPDENIPRAGLRSLKATGLSLMPDGLEAGWQLQDLADLLAFLKDPDGSLLPP